MKTVLTALLLVLTGFELWAQVPGPNIPQRRLPRYSATNGVPGIPPRYQPATPNAPGTPGNPAGAPGGFPSGTGNPGFPGGPGAVQSSTPVNPASTVNPVSMQTAQPEEIIPADMIQFEGVELNQVLDIYAKLVNRTLLRAQLPQAQIILKTQTPLTKTEAIEALQAVLALNGVSVVNVGDKFVKVVPSTDAGTAGEVIDRAGSTNLPALGSYITHVVQLNYVKPSLMLPILTPFAKLKDIIPLDDNGILVIRDYAENVKRMLEMIAMVDVSVPAEYIPEVIPIRYAKVDDIASALSALGGGGSVTPVGTAPSSTPISGFGGGNRMSGQGGISGLGGTGYGGTGSSYGSNPYQSGLGGGSTFNRGGYTGQTTPNGTPSGGATTFQQRLQSIISSTGGGGGGGPGGKQEIQLFGQTKIIPMESTSAILIYATRQDMQVIHSIIDKLDVPLPQVLVEAVIMDVTLGNTFNLGISAAQNPVANGQFIGGGGVNNSSSGSPFVDFVKTITQTTNSSGLLTGVTTTIGTLGSSGTNSGFANNLPGGLSYYANIGPNWDLALTAAESDNHANIIQRPRIQTSQAKPAQFFVGNTVPYVTGTYNGYNGYGGNSYAQLSVGVELDVTPFINPEGLVVMDIQQEIDDLNGYTAIANVGNVPNTIKRTLNTEIAVRNRDTVMLGGFIKSDKTHSQSGVPFLSDIPILGNLFKQRQDTKDREELLVLMRPTVLDTPKMAAEQTRIEEQRLPGVSEAASENAADERSLLDAQRKREERKFKSSGKYDGFFVPPPEELDTNAGPQGSVEPSAQPGADSQGYVVPPPTPSAVDNNSAPPDDATSQQRAAAALAQKMAELNSTNAPH